MKHHKASKLRPSPLDGGLPQEPLHAYESGVEKSPMLMKMLSQNETTVADDEDDDDDDDVDDDEESSRMKMSG